MVYDHNASFFVTTGDSTRGKKFTAVGLLLLSLNRILEDSLPTPRISKILIPILSLPPHHHRATTEPTGSVEPRLSSSCLTAPLHLFVYSQHSIRSSALLSLPGRCKLSMCPHCGSRTDGFEHKALSAWLNERLRYSRVGRDWPDDFVLSAAVLQKRHFEDVALPKSRTSCSWRGYLWRSWQPSAEGNALQRPEGGGRSGSERALECQFLISSGHLRFCSRGRCGRRASEVVMFRLRPQTHQNQTPSSPPPKVTLLASASVRFHSPLMQRWLQTQAAILNWLVGISLNVRRVV